MTANVANIWRHPLKSHGREAVSAVDLEPGKTMPFDRLWAVTHDTSRFNTAKPEWAECVNFARGSKNPALMAIDARLATDTRALTLSHPERPDLTFHPDQPEDVARFLDWLKPLNLPDKMRPTGIVSAAERGMTDTDYPSISILSNASLAALSAPAGSTVSPLRFRGNFWLDGLAPWQEFDWIGQEIEIGSVRLKVSEPIGRCLATTANPDNGQRDIDTLDLLKTGWGHTDFGVYAEVIKGGTIRVSDTLTVVKA